MIQRCRQGDREAQRELYAQTSQQIYGVLLKMTRNPDDAFDLAQSTYILAFERIGQFDEKGSLAAWLYRIAVNEALQFLRRSRTTRRHLEGLARHRDSHVTGDGTTRRMDVGVALAQLPPADRAILLLRYHERLSYREIADCMELPDGTVASRLNRAREKMREILGKGYGPAEEADGSTHQNDGNMFSQGVRPRAKLAD